MTPGQRNVYDALVRYIDENDGWSPTMRELAEAAGLASVATVSFHLDKLEQAGYVELRPGREAGVRPTVRKPFRKVFGESDPVALGIAGEEWTI